MSVRLYYSFASERYYVEIAGNKEFARFKERFGAILEDKGWGCGTSGNRFWRSYSSGYKMSNAMQLLEQHCGLVKDWADTNGSRVYYHSVPHVAGGVGVLGERLYAQRDGANCDFMLVSSTGEQFKVHKLVLSARSEVLQRAFDNGDLSEHCVDLKENKLPLPDADDKAVGAFVKAIYTGKYELKCTQEPESVLALLQLVDMYMVDDIKTCIERDLMRCVNRENAKAMVAIADRYKLDTLNDAIFSSLISIA